MWYKLIFKGFKEKRLDEITSKFTPAYAMAEFPPSMAVFWMNDIAGATFYFSPECESIASEFGAEPCKKPSHSKDLDILCGDYSAWEICFPGFDPTKKFE